MNLKEIKALTFDTGGTVLDWHSGFRDAFAAAGQRHGIRRDWAALANDLRRRSMQAMLNLGENGPPEYNFDEAHHFCLEALLQDEGLEAFDAQDRRAIAWEAPHGFDAWPDVREGLAALRRDRIVASFSLLSYRLIIDSSRRNGLVWDAVLSCEGLGVYKLLPEAYRRAAGRLQLDPAECLMVACHPYDLDAARQVGFRTALVRRPREWGDRPPETPAQGETGAYDLEVDSITELAAALRG
jgi:2-haloacid dehalogenase